MKLEKWVPAVYATYFCMFREIAFKYGYNLVIHGSMERDIDLIAIPWIENPKDHFDMLREFVETIGWKQNIDESLPYYGKPELKPHGRIAYIMVGGGDNTYFDISVMPTLKNGE